MKVSLSQLMLKLVLRPTLLYTSSAYYFVVLFAIPVPTFGRVDRGSEVEVDVGAHVYLNGRKGGQSDSNPAIWKAMVAQ